MEDRLPGADELLPVAEAAARYRAAADTGIFVNARCDTFRGADVATDGGALVAATLERARAYADAGAGSLRSEEHTSELQSLMRISYAVFCLTKKNKPKKYLHTTMPTLTHIE